MCRGVNNHRYKVTVSLDNELLEEYQFENFDDAKEKNRVLLAEYLVGYGVIWDMISEEEHLKYLLGLSYDELKEMEEDAICDKELDYSIRLELVS